MWVSFLSIRIKQDISRKGILCLCSEHYNIAWNNRYLINIFFSINIFNAKINLLCYLLSVSISQLYIFWSQDCQFLCHKSFHYKQLKTELKQLNQWTKPALHWLYRNSPVGQLALGEDWSSLLFKHYDQYLPFLCLCSASTDKSFIHRLYIMAPCGSKDTNANLHLYQTL